MPKKEDKNVTIDSDFADETVKPAKKEKAPKKEEPKKPKKAINFYKEGAEEVTLEKSPAPEIEDRLLKEIDTSRTDFYKDYKKKNTLKSIFSGAMILVMLAGWIVPGTILDDSSSNASLVISIVICGLCLVGLGVYSHFFKQKADKGIKNYFATYYANSFQYAFSDTTISDYEGNIDNKLSNELFDACKLYKNVFKVGSRFFSTFKYDGKECSICDTAAQVKGAKTLQTIFVGKYMTVSNSYEGTPIYIYIKGNKRAIPPNNIESFELIEDNPNYVVYGDKKDKDALTEEIKDVISKVETNATLVDVAISVQPGKTYFALGYEDNLMVIPLPTKLDPRPYEQFKKDITYFVEVSKVFDK